MVIETPEEFRPTPEMKGPSLSVKLEACGRMEDSSGMSISCGGRRAELRITFPAVSLRARQVTLRLSGDLGEWAVVVPVKPLGGVARRPQPISGAKVTRQGLMLEVTGAVFDLDRTVVRILASAAPPIRFIRGVGTEMGGRRLPGSELSLVDDLGNTYIEQAGAEDRSDPAGREHTVVFPQVQSSATVFDCISHSCVSRRAATLPSLSYRSSPASFESAGTRSRSRPPKRTWNPWLIFIRFASSIAGLTISRLAVS